MLDDATIAATIDALLAARAADASICPSEVARAVSPADWRALMPTVRRVAAARAQEGVIRITQGAAVIDPHDVLAERVRGPLRIRR